MAEQNADEAIFVYDGRSPGVLTSSDGLHPGQRVAVVYNGNRVQLEDIIRFGDDGYVSRIESCYNNSVEDKEQKNGYDYRVDVFGAGPSSGRGWIYFTDEEPDHYSLSFYAHKPHSDYVRYNSTRPTIHTITWEPIGPIKV